MRNEDWMPGPLNLDSEVRDQAPVVPPRWCLSPPIRRSDLRHLHLECSTRRSMLEPPRAPRAARYSALQPPRSSSVAQYLESCTPRAVSGIRCSPPSARFPVLVVQYSIL